MNHAYLVDSEQLFSVPQTQLFFLQGRLSEVPEPESLRKRLLCIETSQTSLHIIGVVMERLALCATFVRYLPLANRVQNTKPFIFLHYITHLNPIFVGAALNNQSVLP